ncbi:hypothetical protein PNOK_0297300 [Pyrrhoderma noxium]|uniref:Uncharacterized protein n=1 Tax=Pyrrhoderma noxium TaxID=2282107 RepID=A0A286UL48_9AGAM|nr:hypothetical protein PNOK_0297300 [Pyrrhoderma noxium]
MYIYPFILTNNLEKSGARGSLTPIFHRRSLYLPNGWYTQVRITRMVLCSYIRTATSKHYCFRKIDLV